MGGGGSERSCEMFYPLGSTNKLLFKSMDEQNQNIVSFFVASTGELISFRYGQELSSGNRLLLPFDVRMHLKKKKQHGSGTVSKQYWSKRPNTKMYKHSKVNERHD